MTKVCNDNGKKANWFFVKKFRKRKAKKIKDSKQEKIVTIFVKIMLV